MRCSSRVGRTTRQLPGHFWPERQVMSDSKRNETINRIESEIPRLRRYARHLARDADHADDLVQDCLVRAIAKIDSWQPGTNLRAWLIVILRNAFFNDCRKAKRERDSMEDLKLAIPQVIPAQQDVRLILSEMEQAFYSLSTDHREALTLVAIEGLTYDQAAETLDVSIGTIKSRISRARSRLCELTNQDESRLGANRKTGGDAL